MLVCGAGRKATVVGMLGLMLACAWGRPAAAAGALTVSPSSLDFGKRYLGSGSSPADTVTIENVGDAPVVISGLDTSATYCDQYAVTDPLSFSLAPGATTTFTVSYDPSAAGVHATSIYIESNEPASPLELPVLGLCSALRPSVAAPDFGSQPISIASTPMSITLTNEGASTLNVVSVVETGAHGADYSYTGPLATSLISGASTTMTVTFTPQDVGLRTITIQITTDDAVVSTTELSCSGTGTNQPPTASADGGAGFTTDEDSPFTTANVLTNDSDPNGDTPSVSGFNDTGTLGTVVDNGDGTFDYDPAGQFEALNDGESAVDTFTYTASDGRGETDTAVVTITINGADEAAPVPDDGGGCALGTGGSGALPALLAALVLLVLARRRRRAPVA
ncbi:MAG: choice-of-anchor D domain-containing protein [Planctomycetota bacterium]|jgi:VCBS repeat-containing protein